MRQRVVRAFRPDEHQLHHRHVHGHPNQSSVDEWSGPWVNSWQVTPAIDFRPGVQNCAGAQIYVRNGGWVRWQFFGCWTG